VTTIKNYASAFRTSGSFPLDVNKPLGNVKIRKPIESDLVQNKNRRRVNIGSKALTCDELRLKIAQQPYKMEFNSIYDILRIPTIPDILNYIYSKPEKLWNPIPI
jgi:hypothetical protein